MIIASQICGTVSKISSTKIEILSDFGNVVLDEKNMATLEHCGRHIDDNVENLVDLDELSEVRRGNMLICIILTAF